MKIEIISVTKKDFEEIETNEPSPFYRRYAPDHWGHFLGDLHGWHRYMKPDILEEAYQEFMRVHSDDQ